MAAAKTRGRAPAHGASLPPCACSTQSPVARRPRGSEWPLCPLSPQGPAVRGSATGLRTRRAGRTSSAGTLTAQHGLSVVGPQDTLTVLDVPAGGRRTAGDTQGSGHRRLLQGLLPADARETTGSKLSSPP